jgi:hypothetical protein
MILLVMGVALQCGNLCSYIINTVLMYEVPEITGKTMLW